MGATGAIGAADAMGAYPIAFCVTIGINKSLNQNKIKKLYEGMNSACKEFGGYLVGGFRAWGDEGYGGVRIFRALTRPAVFTLRAVPPTLP